MTRRMLILVALSVCISGGTLPAQEKPASHVILLGTIKVKPGREDDFKKVLAEMSVRMRREDHGNVRFEFYRAAAGRGQQAETASTWYEYEEWVDPGIVKRARQMGRADSADDVEGNDGELLVRPADARRFPVSA